MLRMIATSCHDLPLNAFNFVNIQWAGPGQSVFWLPIILRAWTEFCFIVSNCISLVHVDPILTSVVVCLATKRKISAFNKPCLVIQNKLSHVHLVYSSLHVHVVYSSNYCSGYSAAAADVLSAISAADAALSASVGGCDGAFGGYVVLHGRDV